MCDFMKLILKSFVQFVYEENKFAFVKLLNEIEKLLKEYYIIIKCGDTTWYLISPIETHADNK